MNSHFPSNYSEYDERPDSPLPPMRRPKWTASVTQMIIAVLIPVFLGLGGWGLLNIAGVQSRLAAAEARIENTHDDLSKVDNRLIRMEDKLDRLAEQTAQIRNAVAPKRRSAEAP